jgi:S1-C subfamily serine protease
MNMHRLALSSFTAALVVLAIVRSAALSQQVPDPDFDAKVARPAYTDRLPAVLFDEAHHNFHTAGNRYRAFADLITSDGYRITPNRQPLARATLQPYQVLVIAGAMGAAELNSPDAAKPAFTPAECDAVYEWVEAGGALLLITDYNPWAQAAEGLGMRFGVDMSKLMTQDRANSVKESAARLLFTADNGLLGDHPILRGRSAAERIGRVVSFAGQSLKGPAGGTDLLKLGDTAVDREVDAKGNATTGQGVSAAGRAQGVALTVGKGRVVVLGEAAMLTAQVNGPTRKPMGINVPGNDNRQLALNVMHWLSNLPGLSGASTARPTVATGRAQPAAAPVRPMSTADIVAESEPSVALVRCKSGGSGSGFLVRPGVLATNAHVIDDEFIANLEIQFPSAPQGKKGPYSAQLLYEDGKRDLALLAVKTDLAPLRVAASYTFRKGEDITVIGNPGLEDDKVLENAISRGVMSTKTKLDGQDFYQLGIAINPGNSGGPVFDSSGQVIGVATRKSSAKESLAFSIPIEDLRAAMKTQAGQSAVDAERVASRHRLVTAVKGLSGGGAWYCLALDVRRTAAGRPALKKVAQRYTRAIAQLEREWLQTVALEVPNVRNDRLIAGSVRDKFGQLADNLGKLKAAYQSSRPADLKNDELRQLKATHRKLITGLYDALKLDLPEAMMVVFNDNPVAAAKGALVVRPGAMAQQADPDFETEVANPAYTSEHPRVLIDEAHNNYLTAGGRYKPLADLLGSDGYTVAAHQKPFTREGLAGCAVLVIAGARGGTAKADVAKLAFGKEECAAVRDWVQGGGALLLVTDQPPWGPAAAELAATLGVDTSQGVTSDPASTEEFGRLVFSRENKRLGDHPITHGRGDAERLGSVFTFVGQSLKGPEGSVTLLKLADSAVDLVDAKEISAAGRCQGLAFTLGKGRVVVLGEAGMLSAQYTGQPPRRSGMNVPGCDNRQLALNIMHWLSGLTGP